MHRLGPLGRAHAPHPALAMLVALAGSCADGGGDPALDAEGRAESPLAFEVNPFVGTALEGQTFPGAVSPWGMASPSPHTRRTSLAEFVGADFLEGGLAFSGYKWGDPTIHGFGTAHLSGVGCPDLGGPVVVPFVGAPPADFAQAGSAYRDQAAHAGYYAVHLEGPNAFAEMTATTRTGVMRFRFDQPAQGPGLLIDTTQSLSVAHTGGHVRWVSDSEIEGYAHFGLFCGQPNEGRVHFVARVEGPVVDRGLLIGGRVSADLEATGAVGAFVRFPQGHDEAVTMTLGLSWVSVDGARANLDAERLPFDAARAQAERAWQGVLERVEVEGGRAADRRAFYTALYHAALHPNVATDVDGGRLRFPDASPAVTDPRDPRYAVFSLWDTYRTLHPLLTLIHPRRQGAMVRTMADMTSAGAPPKWALWGAEVQMMVGDPAAIVFADSLAKGIDDFDVRAAFEVMLAASTDPDHRPGVDSYLQRGWIPMEEAGLALAGGVWGPVATTLEYALADASLARIAAHLGDDARAAELRERSLGYRALFDPETGTLRPRMADGSFLTPYDPDEFRTQSSGGAGGPGFVEGTAWQYAFMAPHDVEGLIDLHGGPAPFLERVQGVFDAGRFTVFNEPDLAYPYLFTYVDGQAHRTQRQVRRVMAERFGDGPDGLQGNDDAGTISAWYVFSAMGLFPVTPGLAEYRLGSPLFERITLHLGDEVGQGPTFVVEAPGNAADAPYVRRVTLNGQPLQGPALRHADVVAGGTLRLEMGRSPP